MGGLTARFASDEFSLVMKMLAGRLKDTADMHLLFRRFGLHRSADIAALTTRLYGDDSVPAVEYDDMPDHAMRMLRDIRNADPTWPVDPDDRRTLT